MINVYKKVLAIIIPVALAGTLLVVLIMHVAVRYALSRLSFLATEHLQEIERATSIIDVAVATLTLCATTVFLLATLSRFKILANRDVGQYLQAIENATNHIVMTDTNGVIVYANKGAEIITGYTVAEMIGNTPRLWGGLMPVEFYKNFWRTIKYNRETFHGEVKNRRKNQEEYYALIHVSPLNDREGQHSGFIAIEEDITERKRKEIDLEHARTAARNVLEDLQDEKQKLAETNARNDALLQGIGDGVVAVDRDRGVLFMNSRAATMLGVDQYHARGKKFYDLWEVEDDNGNRIPLEMRPLERVLSGGAAQVVDATAHYWYVRSDRVKFPVAITATPIIVGGKTMMGAVAIFRDIQKEIELDRAKTEFISIASHQLRTPVSGLNWLTEALQFTANTLSAKQKTYVRDLSVLSKRLVGLVEDLLNISRIQLRASSMTEKSGVDISACIEECIQETKPYARSKKHTILFNNSMAGPLQIVLNRQSLYNALQNLVVNAIDYSPADTAVTVTLDADDGWIKVAVSNTGPALTKEEQAHLFQKFYRSESAKKMKAEGTGLGLYITKIIIEEMGGTVGFQSNEGEDTVFWFKLKRA